MILLQIYPDNGRLKWPTGISDAQLCSLLDPEAVRRAAEVTQLLDKLLHDDPLHTLLIPLLPAWAPRKASARWWTWRILPDEWRALVPEPEGRPPETPAAPVQPVDDSKDRLERLAEYGMQCLEKLEAQAARRPDLRVLTLWTKVRVRDQYRENLRRKAQGKTATKIRVYSQAPTTRREFEYRVRAQNEEHARHLMFREQISQGDGEGILTLIDPAGQKLL